MNERLAADTFPAGVKMRLLGDRILVKPLDWSPETQIHAIRAGRPVRGFVVSTGPGVHRKKYSADRSTVSDTATFIPMTVQVGQIVNWGGLNIYDGAGYNFPEVVIGNEVHLLIQEQDVAFIENG